MGDEDEALVTSFQALPLTRAAHPRAAGRFLRPFLRDCSQSVISQSVSQQQVQNSAACAHTRHEQPRDALQRHAEPPEGTPVQGAGHRGPGGRQDVHHQALRAPDLLHKLPGHHRSGLRPEGVELGL